MTSPLASAPFEGWQLVTDAAALLTYARDASLETGRPDGVFLPSSAEDIQRLVSWAAEHGLPLIARGAGTGLAGGAVAERGGIIVVQTHMNHVLDLDVVGRSALVEAGAVNEMVEIRVKAEGLYYPPDPSSGRSSCLGGNLGTNAGGPHCFKYGVTTNYVTGVEAVLSDGRAVTLGGRALDVPGYDLCGLMVGSEGTLGLITRAYLRLIRNPPGVKTMLVAFASIEQAGEAVSAVIAAGLVPAALEVIDQRAMRMIEAYYEVGLPVEAGAALIVEVDGYPEGLDAQMDAVAALLQTHGGFDLQVAQTEEERQRIWYGRKSAAGAIARIAPGYYLTDVTVRRSQLAEVLTRVNEICARHDLQTASFFHAGDGNLHPLILCDPRDEAFMRRVHAAVGEIIRLCIEKDGSITGEHGVGMEKRAYLSEMYSSAELSAMQEVKAAFDPEGLFNPGKVLPAEWPAPVLPPLVAPFSFPFAPATAAEAASGLRALSEAGTTIRIGSAPEGDSSVADIWLSTRKLTGIHAFAPEDLYVTVGAGTLWAEVQDFLAPHGMQLPLVAPWPDATVGGLISVNLNAPLRMRYGALRDVLLCATVVLADGRVIRAGRPLVKNVAGYDLPKVFVGAYGTLGLLIDVTFKLIPRPRMRRTVVVPASDLHGALALAARVLPQALVASAIGVVRGLSLPGLPVVRFPVGASMVLYTAEGMPEDVEAEMAALADIWHAESVEVTEGGVTGSAAWAALLRQRGPEHLVVRAGVPVLALPELVASINTAEDPCFIDYAAGLVYAAYPAEEAAAAEAWLTTLRRTAVTQGGYAVAVSVPDELKGRVDSWGGRPDAFAVMQRLKAAWDPAGILNPGVFMV